VMTPKQIELARHALGLNYRSKCSYRNYFVTSPGSYDYQEWLDLVKKGLANKKKYPFSNDDIFFLTLKGAKEALSFGESLRAEDFPVKSLQEK